MADPECPLDHRAVAVDGLAALAVLAVLLVSQARMGLPDASPAVEVVRVLGSVVGCAAVVARRRVPRTALGVATVAAVVTSASGGPPQVALCVALTAWSAATLGPPVRAWLPPLVLSAVVAGADAVGQISGWFAAMIASAAVICAGWSAGLASRERRSRLAAAAERQAEQERQRLAALRQAVADERLVIARELHDVVAHAMSVIAVRAGVARVVMDSDPVEVKEALGIIETTTRQALQEMRLLVGVLRGDGELAADLVPAPGLAVLDGLVHQVQRAGVEVDVRTHGTPRALPAGVDLSAYRIAQEALTNVVRHAGPTTATLEIDYQADQVVIDVVDAGAPPGRAQPPSSDTGHGLIGMAERVALFGGRLETGAHGRGFRVHALLRTDREPA